MLLFYHAARLILFPQEAQSLAHTKKRRSALGDSLRVLYANVAPIYKLAMEEPRWGEGFLTSSSLIPMFRADFPGFTRKIVEYSPYLLTGEHYLYLYRDGDTIFYVGRSVQPLERLLQHLGRALPYAPDAVGLVIQENMPESLRWTIDLYTLSDCQEAVKAYQPESVTAFGRYLAQGAMRKEAMMIAEEALIWQCRPHLNQQNATWYSNPLPDRYVRQEIVNEGLTLPDTKSD